MVPPHLQGFLKEKHQGPRELLPVSASCPLLPYLASSPALLTGCAPHPPYPTLGSIFSLPG